MADFRISQAERDKVKDSDFAGPHRSFPIRNQQDVYDAARLIGHADDPEAVKRKIIAIARRKGLSLPKSWESVKHSKRLRVRFSLSDERQERNGWAIYPNSILFRAGTYKSHNFTMTPEELAATVAEFCGPMGGNVEHTDFMQDRACVLRRVWVDPSDPSVMRGDVALPVNFDTGLTIRERRPSLELNPKTKLIEGIALTATPAVKDAVLLSQQTLEFGRRGHSTMEGQSVIQMIHDHSAMHGAICETGGKTKMHSRREVGGLQKIHDTAVAHGATCSGGKRMGYSDPSHKESKMKVNLKSLLPAWITGGMPDEIEIDADSGAAVPAEKEKFSEAEIEKRINERVATATAKFRSEIARSNLEIDAEKFVDEVIAAGRAYPSEKTLLVTEFRQRADEDCADLMNGKEPKVNFSVWTKDGFKAATGSRVESFKNMILARPQHRRDQEWLTHDQLPSQFRTLGDGGEDPFAADVENAKKWASRRNGMAKS